MRKVSCKVCGEKWAARNARLSIWYQQHLERHRLLEPSRNKGEPVDQWLDRLIKWRQVYFEDSAYPDGPERPTKLVCGKCGADWEGSGSPAYCRSCLASSFAIAVKK